jgi:5-methyltetrahydrofolate--homocysteine methyltransferase
MNGQLKIKALLADKIAILDGSMGTMLQKMGMPAGACPEIWCLKNPELLKEVHRLYRDSGAEIIYTATLGSNRYKLGEYGEKDVKGINKRLAQIAREAVGDTALLAGDIGSSGRFIEPFGDLSFADAVACFKEQATGLLAGGVDLFVIETIFDIQEARAALLAVKEISDHFTIVTMTFDKSGLTLNGTDPLTSLVTLQSLGAQAVGCNCSTGPAEMIPLIKQMKPYACVPLVAKPNAGMPVLENGKTVFRMKEKEFSILGKELVKAGATMVGGCCGTNPQFIRSLSQLVQENSHKPVLLPSLSAVSSSSSALIIKRDDPLYIIGERINPTGKKKLQQELASGHFTLVQQMAREQAQNGASLLDVNAGMPGIDETQMLRELVKILSLKSHLPLVIDSPNPQSIEEALRLYPGRALVNSLSGEKKKFEQLLPVIKHYGAMSIVLPITGKSIPLSARERMVIIEEIVQKALQEGLAKSDLVVDGLVMAVSSQPLAARETLATIRYCTETLGCLSVIGLSNVSFGLPERSLINAAFLSKAQAMGLTFAIANPSEVSLLQAKLASDLLEGKDENAKRFISFFINKNQASPEKEKAAATPVQAVTEAILAGNREEINTLLDDALRHDVGPEKLVNDYMIPAITQVGELFETKKYFLPQLMASAEAMKAGFAHLEPLLKKEAHQAKTTVLLATVEGDIHDIGKNIVALILRNHGIKVIDLGKDVKANTILTQAQKEKPDLIALSALMTTTMLKMKEVIELARQKNITCPFLLGGAVVTEKFAQTLGAYYAKDGVEAVKKVKKLVLK